MITMKPLTLTDIIEPDLNVLFCGLNPGLASAAGGFHFMSKSTRFWKALHLAGFTIEQIKPQDDRTLLDYGCGLTSAVARATVSASELGKNEFLQSSKVLEKKVSEYKPRYIAFLGKAAYSEISGQKNLEWGLQEKDFAGAKVWILPNPSGLNFAFSLADLVEYYGDLYAAVLRDKA